jgi:hypothetical protein
MSSLPDFYFSDPRLVLVPIEHLSPTGVSREFAALAAARAGWSAAQIDLLDAGFARYWARTADLARRTATWAPPRLRHIAVVADPLAVHPCAQLLNTSAWTLYAADLDPARSHPELVAYLLAHGERMAITGEVTMAALHNAAWWFDRTDEECAAFAAAAARSTRPDATALHGLAAALDWLRVLGHATLRPVPAATHRPIPATGLLVPHRLDARPPELVDQWAASARAAVAAYHDRWRGTDLAAVRALLEWLADSAPLVLIVGGDGRVLWTPDAAGRVSALREALQRACGAAVRDVHRDLEIVDRQTRRVLGALREPAALPAVASETEQRGYVFLHRERRLLAYNLDEPGVDRCNGPALPFARAMLGARAAHEWAHLAVDAAWVPCREPHQLAHRVEALAARFDAAIAAAPAAVSATTAADLDSLVGSEHAASPGAALAAVLVRRMPDFQANLLAQRFLDNAERETYVRHNIRTLRGQYPPAKLWRMLTRYLHELQYLRFSAVADARAFFLRSTWCDADFIDSGVLRASDFDALAAAVAAICDCYAVDETRFL